MGKKKTNRNQDKENNNSDFASFKIVLFYCLLIIFLPVLTFFSVKNFLFDDYLGLDSAQSNIYSAVSAVIVLHMALGLYIYRAYFDAPDYEQGKENKID